MLCANNIRKWLLNNKLLVNICTTIKNVLLRKIFATIVATIITAIYSSKTIELEKKNAL